MNDYSNDLQKTLKDTLTLSIYALFISSFFMFIFNIIFVVSALYTVKLHNKIMDDENRVVLITLLKQ